MIATRVLIVLGGMLLFLAGYWGRTRSDVTPRYTAGVGSGLSPGSRRFFGSIVAVIGVVIILSGLTGFPPEIMH